MVYCFDKSINHEEIIYEEFVKLMDEKKYGNIDFKNTKIQKFCIFYSIFRCIKISISKIRTKLTSNYKGLDIVQLLNTLK